MMPSPFFPLLTRQRQGCLQPLVITVLMNVTRCAIVRCGCGVIKAFLTSEETCVCVCECERERFRPLCGHCLIAGICDANLGAHLHGGCVCVSMHIFVRAYLHTRVYPLFFIFFLPACVHSTCMKSRQPI